MRRLHLAASAALLASLLIPAIAAAHLPGSLPFPPPPSGLTMDLILHVPGAPTPQPPA